MSEYINEVITLVHYIAVGRAIPVATNSLIFYPIAQNSNNYITT